ncbi:ParA family protein [Nesterenkonia sp. NBAIMH1]|uniref:ParA family protein n=1 Tax=Nesterenkonia sp. NBAIMH1 TaxID=2600320 RepID=UPI0011B3CDC3|nr:ParA family protein [Nesterenkonia sp. NBAIMH1]
MDRNVSTIVFFNNKGGVGKTTLACNFAHYAAEELNLDVTILDLDPQANATQLVLTDNQWQEIYADFDRSEDESIMRAFRDIRDGDSSVPTDLRFHESFRFKCKVLAGHPSMSTVEDLLSQAWTELRAGDVGGARRTNWLHTLRQSIDSELVIIDLGPSLGALNRSALLSSTHFMTPMAADLFSLYALKNIGEWMHRWIAEYTDSMHRALEGNATSQRLRKLPQTPEVQEGYLGYTVQQYMAKKTNGEYRPTVAYDRFKSQIPDHAMALKNISAGEMDYDLGIVPNMFAMVPLAQAVHAPIRALVPSDGVRGAQNYQKQRYTESLDQIFRRIAENAGLSNE